MFLKKKIFMAKKLYADFKRGDDFYQISENYQSPELGEYYFIFDESVVKSGKVQALITESDENGIPLNRPYIDVKSDDLFYYPITIGQMGLSVFQTYLNTNSKEDLSRFLKFADWFTKYATIDDKLGARWMTDIPLPAYQNSGPWQSAFTQSRAISILLRAYQQNQDPEHEKLAKLALKPFQVPVKDGGVSSEAPWGICYEEYTSSVPTLVLNGHIFALFGLFDFQRVFPNDEECNLLVKDGLASLKKSLPYYDMGYWTRYNYCEAEFYPDIDPATISYHRLHIMLLKVMTRLDPDPIYAEYIEKWKSYIGPYNFLKVSFMKYNALKKMGRV